MSNTNSNSPLDPARFDDEGLLVAIIGSAVKFGAALGILGFMLKSDHAPDEVGGVVAALSRLGQDVMPLPLAGAILGAIGGAIYGWVRHQRDHEHREKLRNVAAATGAEYIARDSGLDALLRKYFHGSGSVHCSHLLRLGNQGVDLTIAELVATSVENRGAATSWSGENQRKRIRAKGQTVAFARAAGTPIPEFVVQPESTLLNVASGILGGRDIDFPSHPVFSRQYRVTALDEAGLRRVLTPQVIMVLEKAPGITISGRGEGVLLYRQGVLVDPNALARFIRSANLILSPIVSAAKGAGGQGTG